MNTTDLDIDSPVLMVYVVKHTEEKIGHDQDRTLGLLFTFLHCVDTVKTVNLHASGYEFPAAA